MHNSLNVPTAIAWIIVILGAVAVLWSLRHPRKRIKRTPTSNPTRRLSYVVVTGDQARVEPYPYVYVSNDGSARELHTNERKYLETPFDPLDGARPRIKDTLSQKDGWGEIKGYFRRSNLPRGTPVHPAPADDPCKPLTKENQIQFLRARGLEVIENSDSTVTVKKRNT